MIITIKGLDKELAYLLYDEDFGKVEESDDMYNVVLNDEVILKANYHITLDKGGRLFTLYIQEFQEIEIV